jgi:hypothetical protein
VVVARRRRARTERAVGRHVLGAIPLSRAATETQKYRRVHLGPHGEDRGRVVWPESFLILSKPGGADALTIDCAEGRPTSPGATTFLHDAAGSVWADSIGVLVERWLRAMERRVAHFDRSLSKWTFVSEKAIGELNKI